jgi:hypothetical protein
MNAVQRVENRSLSAFPAHRDFRRQRAAGNAGKIDNRFGRRERTLSSVCFAHLFGLAALARP